MAKANNQTALKYWLLHYYNWFDEVYDIYTYIQEEPPMKEFEKYAKKRDDNGYVILYTAEPDPEREGLLVEAKEIRKDEGLKPEGR